jgi:hypothetical protein
MQLYDLYVRLDFQDLPAQPPQAFLVSFESEVARREWREDFDGLLRLLNDELELGWMTCISPEYTDAGEGAGHEAMRWTPAEAITTVKQWYLAAKGEVPPDA